MKKNKIEVIDNSMPIPSSRDINTFLEEFGITTSQLQDILDYQGKPGDILQFDRIATNEGYIWTGNYCYWLNDRVIYSNEQRQIVDYLKFINSKVK